MKTSKGLKLSALLCLAALSGASADSLAIETGAEASMLEKFAHLQKSLQKSSVNCVLPEKGDCKLENLCSAVVPNRNSAYLYKNEAGQGLPNFKLAYAEQSYKSCMNSKEKAAVAEPTDPFMNPGLLTKSSNQDAKKQYQQALERTQAVFEDARKRLVVLLTSKKTAKNAAQIEAMLLRLNAVKPRFLQDFSDRGLVESGCVLPNAFYFPEGTHGHTVTVCPQLMNLPEPALYFTLAHELAHSFDPCMVSYHLTASGDGAAKKWQAKHPVFGAMAAQEKIAAKGIPPKDNPFQNSLQCLQSKASTGAAILTSEQQRDRLEQLNAERESMLTSQEQAEDKILPQMLKKARDLDEVNAVAGYCSTWEGDQALAFDGKKFEDEDTRSFLQESFADMMSSQVLAGKLSEIQDPAASKRWAFESQLIPLSQGCVGFDEGQKQFLMDRLQKKRCDTQKIQVLLEIELDHVQHLPMAQRSTRIYLAPERMKKALGCEAKDPVKDCF